MKISNTIAGIATLALATIPMLAMGTAAHAAPVTVQVADLNLASAEGAKEFNRRVEAAADRFCGSQMRLGVTTACKAAVRTEVSEKLAAIQSAPTAYAAR